MYSSSIENISYLRVWKHLTLSTHHRTYFLMSKPFKNFISQEIPEVWRRGMACSKEEAGKNLEAEGNRDGKKKRLEADGNSTFHRERMRNTVLVTPKRGPDVKQLGFLTHTCFFPQNGRVTKTPKKLSLILHCTGLRPSSLKAI